VISVTTNAPYNNRIQVRLNSFAGPFSQEDPPWDSLAAYLPGDMVSSSGINYECVLANAGQTPPNPTYWTPVGAAPLGAFNPVRDLEVYVDGAATPILSAAYDGVNNCYLLFMAQAFNLQGVIQVLHRMPSPPFVDILEVELPGFAIISGYNASGDPFGWGLLWGDTWGDGVN
jgi:hypothetical protein